MRAMQLIRRSLTLHLALAFVATGLFGYALFTSSRPLDWRELIDPREAVAIDVATELESSASSGATLSETIRVPIIAQVVASNPGFGFVVEYNDRAFEYNRPAIPPLLVSKLEATANLAMSESGDCQTYDFNGLHEEVERYRLVKQDCNGRELLIMLFGIRDVPDSYNAGYRSNGGQDWLIQSGLDNYAIGAMAALLYVAIGIFWVRRALGRLDDASVQFLAEGPQSLIPEDKVPLEFLPLVRSINTIAVRASRVLQNQTFFLGAAAHELRTPLTILRLRVDELPDGTIKSGLVKDLRKLSNLMNGLLEFMRISELEANFSTIDLLHVCARAMEQAADAARNAGVTLVFVRDEAPARIEREGVEDLMVLALFNVLNNAISFSKNGDTVTVTLTADAKIRVSDEGPGLAPSVIADLGEPFRKFPSERAGAGLGLSIVQKIMGLHGGTVEGRNLEPHGTLIELDFSLSSGALRQAD